MLEQITAFQAEGEFDGEIITPESGTLVRSACIPASLVGTRVPATASQGLFVDARSCTMPAVRGADCDGQRQPHGGLTWAFWPDQTDSLAQRDTGWIHTTWKVRRKLLDTVIQAFRVAEQVLVPAMVNLDAFYVSHAMEPRQCAASSMVDAHLPPFNRPTSLIPSTWSPGAM